MARPRSITLGAALVVMVILTGCGSTSRRAASASDESRAATPASSAARSSDSRTTAPLKRPARCTARELSASVGEHGPANGTENIVILLHNTSATSCWLGGLLPLSATHTDGTVAPLRFLASTDPALAGSPATATGPGPVEPGRYGAFLVTECLTGGHKCAARSTLYVTLRIQLAPGQLVTMPYPSVFRLGTPGDEGVAEPVPSATGILGR